MEPLSYKIATEAWEFDQIHRLNYRTFVEEIPQHPPSPEHRLVDRFHDENTYFICLRGHTLVGMVAGRTTRPFSLDGKLDDLDSYLPYRGPMYEVRLLAVEPALRRGRVFLRLVQNLVAHYTQRGYGFAVTSGALSQLRLYKRIGWVPFGPVVGTPEAPYQPMYITRAQFEQNVPWSRFGSTEISVRS